MTATPHPAASHHLPAFITAPGDTDVLLVVMAMFLFLAVLAFGILFLRLHHLPEHIAHKGHKVQYEIVAVLCLIALFTHIHLFWIVALLLALIDIPNFGGWMGRIAGSVEKMAGIKPVEESEAPLADRTGVSQGDRGVAAPHETVAHARPAEGTAAVSTSPALAPANTGS